MTEEYKTALLASIAKDKEAITKHVSAKHMVPEERIVVTLAEAVQALLLAHQPPTT